MKKSDTKTYIYICLMHGIEINRVSVARKFNVSPRMVNKYIQDVNCLLADCFIFEKIKFDYTNNRYVLDKN